MDWQSVSSALSRVRNSGQADPYPFFDLSWDMQCIAGIDGRLQRINAACSGTLGYAEADLLARNVLDLFHPDDRGVMAGLWTDLAHGHPVGKSESRFRCADGTFKWVAWRMTPVLPTGLVYMVAHDLTSLRDAEMRCLCTMENSTDAFFAVDQDWKVKQVNRQTELLLMIRRDELLGRSLWELFPEAVGTAFHQAYRNVMETRQPIHLEEFYPHAPLNRWYEVHIYPLDKGLAVYFRDVTERRQAAEKIKRSLQEREVLLREVHHRVKNNLQIICSLLRLQARYLRDETLLQALRDCRERVLAMALLHDQLHRAQDLSNINLGEYIRSLAASLFCSYGVNSSDVQLRMNTADIIVAIDVAIPCGLIVNELISNSLRHAFPQGKGCISLDLQRASAGRAELTIRDDGQGFSAASPSNKNRSLGLWLVDLLAEQIDAAIERFGDTGTAYRLIFQTTESRKEESDEKTSNPFSRG